MNAKQYPILVLALSLLWAAGCAHKPVGSGKYLSMHRHRASPPPAVSSRSESSREPDQPNGHYATSDLTGPYADYPALERFIDKMVSRHGFSRAYLNALFSQVQRKQWTLDYLGRESKPSAPPRPGAWSRYRAKFLTEKHISTGARFWSQYASALQRARTQYGVNPEHIMGIMGVETLYGGNLGNHRIIDALATLAFDYPRRSAYFTDELESFLVLTRDEGIDPAQPVGSYAGAMGLGQFMPSSFLKFAVDFDGDGRKDLWDPVDAIGSVAHYFVRHGWHPGRPVVVPAIVSSPAARRLECGLDTRYPLVSLIRYGVRPLISYPGAESVRLLRLSTISGDEYWLGYDNFYVITRYNHSTHYAMAVHQLAEAVKQRYARLALAAL
jgi:membrane-bound lytic murein transglycosylase B